MPEYARWQRERMRRAIAGLPSPTRAIYRLHLFSGFDYAAISALMNLPIDEVERQIALAIVAIERALRKDDPG